MANINSVFQDALAGQAKAALCEVVARQPRTTVSDLAQLVASTPTLGAITLGEMLGGVAPTKRRGRPPGRKNTPAVASPSGKRKAGRRNVRTGAGREHFDDEVLATLREAGGHEVSATTLREMMGGEAAQIRTSLNRMIERGLVTFSGRARGTRYSLA